jgi:hypothetical protein
MIERNTLRVRSRLGLLAAAGAVAGMLVAVPIQAQPAPRSGQPPQQVTVVNEASEPVPVEVQGTAEARVANTASDPVPVEVHGPLTVHPPSVEPVHRTALVIIAEGEGPEKSQVFYTVPAGKRLVIEHGTFQGQGPTGTTAVVMLGGNAPHGAFYIPGEHYGRFAGRGDMVVGSQAGRLYVDAGGEVRARVILHEFDGSGRFEVGFAGYLVDLP